MAIYIPHNIFHLARLLYVRPEAFGPYYVSLLEEPERIYVSNVQQAFQTQNRLRDNSEIIVNAVYRNVPTSSFIINFSVCKMIRSFIQFAYLYRPVYDI